MEGLTNYTELGELEPRCVPGAAFSRALRTRNADPAKGRERVYLQLVVSSVKQARSRSSNNKNCKYGEAKLKIIPFIYLLSLYH